MKAYLAYGKGNLCFQLPNSLEVKEIKANPSQIIGNAEEAIRYAVANPVGTPPLTEIVKSGEKVVIIVSDITRLWIRSDILLPILLNVLNETGISDEDVSIVISTGDHRPLTEEEHKAICGQEVLDRVSIYDHDCFAQDLVDLGVSSRGTPIKVNKKVMDADKVILTGGITYHLLAGFGGGRKSIAPGVCGYETIQKNHWLALDDKGAEGLNSFIGVGKMKNNPVAEDMIEIARKVGADFILNVVINDNKDYVYIAAGELEQAHLAGSKVVEKLYGIPIEKEADLVIASCGGYPKDIQLYQAIKALENASHAVREDGVIILISECSDAVGSKPFLDFFLHGEVEDLKEALYTNFSMPGFVALRTAGICKRSKVILISSLPDEIVTQVKMIPAHSEEEALELAQRFLGQDSGLVYIMPHGSSTFPKI